MFARQSFWCIAHTLASAGFQPRPYHAYVPSFGEWGFVLAGAGDYEPPARLPDGLRYLTPSTVPQMFDFAADMLPVSAEPNRLNDQVLVRYYEDDWSEIDR